MQLKHAECFLYHGVVYIDAISIIVQASSDANCSNIPTSSNPYHAITGGGMLLELLLPTDPVFISIYTLS